MTDYMSNELIHCIEKRMCLNISIYYHNSLNKPFLRIGKHANDYYANEIWQELSDYVFIGRPDFNYEKLQNLVGKTVLIQYPSDTCWSTEHNLRFMNITAVTEKYIHFENYIKDFVTTSDGTVETFCDKYQERISNFTSKKKTSYVYKIWVHSKMYIDLFSTYSGIKVKEDPVFLEYMYNPDVIKKCELAEQLFSDLYLYNKEVDFVTPTEKKNETKSR